MRNALNRLWNNKRGNVIAIFGAALPLIVGAAGLATDTIQWTLWKRQLQRTADSAAIAGVYDREAANGGTTTTQRSVDHDVAVNRHMAMALLTTPQVSYPANLGVMTNQVQVVLRVQDSLPFSSFFFSTPIIVATARAASIPAGGDACIEALDPTSTTGVKFSGSSAIYMPDCDVFSNSAGANTAVAQGSTDVTANSVGGVGGIQQSNKFHVTAYRPYSPAMPDPFIGVTPNPANMNCGSPQKAFDENTVLVTGGVNCFSSMSVKPGSTNKPIPANFGPIYLNGGGIDFKGNFTCVGCTLVLTNKTAASPIGNITVNATANINISAPLTGTFKGLAIYQDRRAADCNNCNKVNGNSGSIITGGLYFPSRQLQYNGTGTATATCTMFVAKRIEFTGNSGVSNKFKKLSDCSGSGLPSNATMRMIRMVG